MLPGRYLFGENIEAVVLGSWSRVNFGFAYQNLAHQTVLAAPYRFKTMDELFAVGNMAAASMTFVSIPASTMARVLLVLNGLLRFLGQ